MACHRIYAKLGESANRYWVRRQASRLESSVKTYTVRLCPTSTDAVLFTSLHLHHANRTGTNTHCSYSHNLSATSANSTELAAALSHGQPGGLAGDGQLDLEGVGAGHDALVRQQLQQLARLRRRQRLACA